MRKRTKAKNGVDKRRVFVVYGRNPQARTAIFEFLRSIDLAPMEWEEVIASTGNPSPFIGDALEKGFSMAQAAVVVFTGDDMARVGRRFLKPDDTNEEKILKAQPRPNVLFEAGMAMGRYPKRTVFVSIGPYRKFTDLDGRHLVQLSNARTNRTALADRLRAVGCAVKTTNRADWLKAGDFDGAGQDADIPDGTARVRLKMFKRDARDEPEAIYKRKIWIEFRNESDECLLLRQPLWRQGTGGIRATIRAGTFQVKIGNTWCPEKIGAQQINLPPGELCRLWAEPDEKTPMTDLKDMCQSDAQLGTVTMLANAEEISVPV